MSAAREFGELLFSFADYVEANFETVIPAAALALIVWFLVREFTARKSKDE